MSVVRYFYLTFRTSTLYMHIPYTLPYAKMHLNVFSAETVQPLTVSSAKCEDEHVYSLALIFLIRSVRIKIFTGTCTATQSVFVEFTVCTVSQSHCVPPGFM